MSRTAFATRRVLQQQQMMKPTSGKTMQSTVFLSKRQLFSLATRSRFADSVVSSTRQHHFFFVGHSSASVLQQRLFSNDGKQNDDENTQLASPPSQDQHAFFQQQMLEMEAERRSLIGAAESESSIDSASSSTTIISASATTSSGMGNSVFIEQMSEWKAEQKHVFGQELVDEDSDPSQQQQQQANDLEYQELLEDQKEERQLLFQFSKQETAAWGQPPSPQSMQDVLQQVQRARQKQEEMDTLNAAPEDDAEIDNDYEIASSQPTTLPDSRHHHESFSHVSSDGNSVHMVDVGHKTITQRTAHAQSQVILPPSVLQAFSTSNNEMVGPKGPIFATAKIAGIMAAKQTSNLIPLCHPLPLDQVVVDIQLRGNIITIDCRCRVTHKTGVEMEALTGASVAALTIYDMVKAVSHEVTISNTQLVAKSGGKRLVQDGKNVEEKGQ
jgi:cyclic pyranopterin monophosphate synthase